MHLSYNMIEQFGVGGSERMTLPAQRHLPAHVARDLSFRILRDDLRPGETFPDEESLGVELGVSRTVVREALQVLRAKGLVETKTKTGTRVRPSRDWNLLDPDLLQWRYEARPDDAFLRDLVEVRRIIEPPAARLAAMRATPGDLAAIGRWLTAMEAAIEDDDRFINADLGFHAAVLTASGNSLLLQLNRAIGLVLRFSRDVTVSVPGSSAASMPFHRNVLEAICSGDPNEAEARMRALLQRTAEDVTRALGPADDVEVSPGGE